MKNNKKILIINHRINSSSQLSKINTNQGVEIDLRSNMQNIYLNHDPFKTGELFSKWIKKFKHKLIVLNVKEEGLESKILNILKTNKVNNFFFHDQTFSSILKNKNKTKVSIRYSEYEKIENKNKLFDKIKWLWVDNFTEIKIEKKFYLFLKKKKVKICIVSPELVKKKRLNEIKKICLYLKKNNFLIDAVCTKKPKYWIRCLENEN